MEPASLARWKILGAAALFSTGGALIKACTLGGWQVAAFRSGVAAPAILAMSKDARRGWTRKTWLVGCAYAATVLLFVLSTKATTSANAIFLQSTAPLYLLVLGPLWLKEPLRGRDLGLAGAIAAGLACFFLGHEAPQATAPSPLLGNVLAAASGLSWALTVVGLRSLAKSRVGDSNPATPATVAGNAIAFAVALPFALADGTAAPTLRDVGIVAFLGVVQIGVAYVLLTSGAKHAPAFEASLLLLLEPVLNPVWTWVFHGERPGLWALVGGAIILGATTVHALWTTPSRSGRPP